MANHTARDSDQVSVGQQKNIILENISQQKPFYVNELPVWNQKHSKDNIKD